MIPIISPLLSPPPPLDSPPPTPPLVHTPTRFFTFPPLARTRLPTLVLSNAAQDGSASEGSRRGLMASTNARMYSRRQCCLRTWSSKCRRHCCPRSTLLHNRNLPHNCTWSSSHQPKKQGSPKPRVRSDLPASSSATGRRSRAHEEAHEEAPEFVSDYNDSHPSLSAGP